MFPGIGLGMKALSSSTKLAGIAELVGKGAGKAVHGNSKLSTKVQHGYEIVDDTGDVVKTGISGRALNKNGTSPRANSQVNSFNKLAGYDKYSARVAEPSIPGRKAALDWERNNALSLKLNGNSMSKHQRPTPWD